MQYLNWISRRSFSIIPWFCLQGGVEGTYETGAVLYECGVIPGGDMTAEAALCKLCYVLSKPEWDVDKRKEMLCASLRGELTEKEEAQGDVRTQIRFLKAIAVL